MEQESEQKSTPPDAALPAGVEYTFPEKLSPESPILTKEDLANRDRVAVAYSKDLLLEGDTLVYITYPGDSKCFDSTGFEVSAGPQRVHSSRLLGTGSKVFAELLGPKYQYRILRRKKLVNNLPLGIKYIIDLTPPDEGDKAVELTSELSCSIGVTLWHTASQRCGIPNNVVGGEDEIIDATNITSFGSQVLGESTSVKVDVDSSSSNPIIVTNFSRVPSDLLETARDVREFAQAVRMSLEQTRRSRSKSSGAKDAVTVPDYCPIRHRAGIGRLLRVLEGRDPRLDSAPKVWTLFALAKYFDCTSAVVDWIVSWMICHPNSQFIEILPEVSCKIAFGLKNQLICRAAFSILVSEEALSLASREAGRVGADVRRINQFGRLRDDVDEDLRTRIEYASKKFASRICTTFEALADEKLPWLLHLSEYQKLVRFKQTIVDYVQYVEKIDKAAKWLAAIEALELKLKTYIHSRILSSLSAPLTLDQSMSANNHRLAERYMDDSNAHRIDGTFVEIYNKLTDKERIYTRFFWQLLLYTEFPISFQDGLPAIRDPVAITHPIPSVSSLLISQRVVNESILEAVQMGVLNDGLIPLEAIPKPERIYDSYAHSVPTKTSQVEAKSMTGWFDETSRLEPWEPFSVSKIRSELQTARKENTDEWSTSMSHEKQREKWIEPKAQGSWTVETTSDGPEGIEQSSKNRTRDTIDVDEYLAQHHLLSHPSGHENASFSNQRLGAVKSDLVLRLKGNGLVPEAQEVRDPSPYLEMRATSQASGIQPRIVTRFQAWALDGKALNEQARDQNQSTWINESYLSRILRESQNIESSTTSYSVLRSTQKPPPKPIIPGDGQISEFSSFLSLSQLFLDAKVHIRCVANSMLERGEMGFDVTLTDTLLCLGPEEYKYLPLWAGGDDDDSGGVFDDAIPIALAGPNGPGPSYHTGFSSASAASSEFDAMSDGTTIDTSIAVEDGYSDHIDRRLILADDDFHSETFSEDSEVYDRKGKGVDRTGFCASSPTPKSDFSPAATTFDSVQETATSDDGNLYMEYFEDDSDADTTIGLVDMDDGDEESWDEGDAEYFDFGDKDEEMVNI